ncbi:hypothetical protein D3C78_1040430 [compost metagenome]
MPQPQVAQEETDLPRPIGALDQMQGNESRRHDGERLPPQVRHGQSRQHPRPHGHQVAGHAMPQRPYTYAMLVPGSRQFAAEPVVKPVQIMAEHVVNEQQNLIEPGAQNRRKEYRDKDQCRVKFLLFQYVDVAVHDQETNP